MKTVIWGDVHGRQIWKQIVTDNPDADKFIAIGDYFDSFNISTEAQINNFLDIIEYKKSSGKEVVLLIGNHDLHYFPELGDTGTSGYQQIGKFQIEPVIDANREHLQMADYQDNFLFTHAGVGEAWFSNMMNKHAEGAIPKTAKSMSMFVNEVWEKDKQAFEFTGINPYGDDMGQTPVWIRPKSLMKDAQDYKKHIRQVVGHTGQNCIDIEGKSTGGRYYFIDTLGTSKEYLVIEDWKVEARKIFKKYDKSETEEEL